MIRIDGSRGEGGGQMLRTALALSAFLREDFRISNIRAGRPNPGLAPQHLTCIEAVAALCDAEVEGAEIGSKEVSFAPGAITGGEFEFDVGTAGSVSLVLTACIIPALGAKTDTRIMIRGGTDVNWSPPVDYIKLIHSPVAELFGVSTHMEIRSRGFYPEGGGEVEMEISPSAKLHGVVLNSRGHCRIVSGVAYSRNLPDHVVTRMKHAAIKNLIGFERVRIESEVASGRSTGAGIVLAAMCEHAVIGASALGKKGVSAEAVGEGCAADLIETYRSEATVDEHMLDQILPYMALAEGESVVVAEEITQHARTNIAVIEEFLGKRFDVTEQGGRHRISTV